MFKKIIKLLFIFSLFLGSFSRTVHAVDYFPISETLLNNTVSLSGTTGDLQTDDTSYRMLRSFPSAYNGDFQTTTVDIATTGGSTTYADYAVLTWNVPSNGTYLIYATAELKRGSTTAARTAKAQMLIDNVSYAETFVADDVDVDIFRTFSGVELQTLTAGSHTIKIQFGRTHNTSNICAIKNGRITAMRVDNTQFNIPANGTTTSLSYTDISTLTFTPETTEDWLIMAHADVTSSSTTTLSYANLMVGSTQLSESAVKIANTTHTLPFDSYKTMALNGNTSYTFKIQMKNSAAATLTYKNVGLYAIPKSIFQASGNAEAIGQTTCSTCTSASPTTIATLNLNTGVGGTYLITATGEQQNSSLTVYSGINLRIGASVVAQSIVDVGATAQYSSFSLQKVVSVSSGTTAVTVQLFTQTSGTVVKAKDVRIQAIKLGAASSQKMEVEYSGVGNTLPWTKLDYFLNSAFSTASVGTSIQLWNYNSGTYPASGDGFISYTSSATPNIFVNKTQSITTNPTYFRNANTGAWKLKVSSIAASGTWVKWSGDFLKYATTGLPETTESLFRWRADDGAENIGNTEISFSTGVTYPETGADPYDVVSEDFDSDGSLDLAVANSNTNNIAVYMNNGDGSYGLGVTYPTTGIQPRAIISGDFNYDGKPDLATTNYASSNITVFINNGNGTYATGVLYSSVGLNPNDLTTSDLNMDGKLDIITANFDSDDITVFINTGNGIYADGVTYDVRGVMPKSVTAGDFNGDGKPDLATANYSSDDITIFTNNGNGTYGAGVTYPVLGLYPYSVVSDDLDMDGAVDLAVLSYYNKNINVLINNGNGIFATGVTYPVIVASPQKIIVNDFNNDGQPDLLANSQTNESFAILTNNGNGIFGVGITRPTIGRSTFGLTSGDFNKDGKQDIAIASITSDTLEVFFNNTIDGFTYGTFGGGTTYPNIGGQPYAVTPVDCNVDGKPDLIATGMGNSTIRIVTNNGNNTFSVGSSYSTGSYPVSIATSDFNIDGKPDLVTANYLGNNITVLTNTGSCNFGTGVTYSTIDTGPRSVTSADFNKDGKPDLATGNSTNITVFTNNGSGAFGTGVTYPLFGSDAFSITSADFNKDGQPDLATANYMSDNITVFTNTGSGSFGTGVTYPTIGTVPVSITSADFNNDGKADLVTANNTSNNITVFTNNGSGTFGTGVTYPTIGTAPFSINSVDFDGDSQPDIVTANQNSNNITVFTNIGSGLFGTGITYPTYGNFPTHITSADFNTDGKPDLAAINYNSNSLSILSNIAIEVPSGATWLADENVGVTNVPTDSNIRLRFSVGNTGGSGSFNFRLQVAPIGASVGCTDVASGNFSDVPTTVGSAVAVMTTSPNLTNQSETTNQLTDSGTTFVTGKMVQYNSNQSDNISLDTNEFTEVEYNFQMTSNSVSNTPYCFRVVDVGTTLNTYTQVAKLTTIIAASNESPSAPFLPYVNNTTAQSGQQSPVYGLIDHSPAFSAVFDDPDTSDTSSNYQLQIGSDSDWTTAEIWDSTKSSIGSTCNENARCADIVYGGGTSLVDGSTYYWRIKFWDNSDIGSSWSDTQQFSMNNAPTVSNVVINGNNNIDLSENSSIGISWTSTVTDADNYTNLSSVAGKIYRSGLGSTCTLDNNNCYTDAVCDMFNCSGNSCSALCSANLYFFTEATSVGTTFADQYYQAWVQATDNRTEVGSTISSSTTVDVNTLTGFSIGTSLVYGEVFAGSDTGSSNTITTITNTGNSLINLEITGDYMCTDYPSCGALKIDPKNQQFNLNTFTYGTGTTLTTSPQVVNIGISKPTQIPSNSYRNLYWGIGIPSAQGLGSYQGATTILVY